MARIDKYLWAVRLCKTRSIASQMLKSNKVFVNDVEVKASKEVKIGDLISIKKNTAIFTYKVLDLLEKRVGAKLVSDYLINITPTAELEKYQAYQFAQQQYRQNGLGKPTKKDRRTIKTFLKN